MHYHIKITQVKIHTDAYNTKGINRRMQQYAYKTW